MKKPLTSLLLISSLTSFAQQEVGKSTPSLPAYARIAYVNTDSLEAKYLLFREKREEFVAQKEKMESQLEQSYNELQSEADKVQKKAQANELSPTEYEAAQKRFGDMQKDLETKKQSLTDELIKMQEGINSDIKGRLDQFLSRYNKTHHYDCILSYSETGSSILYINKDMDITADVIKGMNKDAGIEGRKEK